MRYSYIILNLLTCKQPFHSHNNHQKATDKAFRTVSESVLKTARAIPGHQKSKTGIHTQVNLPLQTQQSITQSMARRSGHIGLWAWPAPQNCSSTISLLNNSNSFFICVEARKPHLLPRTRLWVRLVPAWRGNYAIYARMAVTKLLVVCWRTVHKSLKKSSQTSLTFLWGKTYIITLPKESHPILVIMTTAPWHWHLYSCSVLTG